jgi:predicted RecA/RadA family phage recombinase
MSNTYRMSGKHLPVASASAAITSGALVFQEGFFGVAITSAAEGASLWIDTQGVHVLTVPAGTLKGDRLYADLGAESAGLTLTETPGDTLIGIAVGDRDAAGKALVLLASQPQPEQA